MILERVCFEKNMASNWRDCAADWASDLRPTCLTPGGRSVSGQVLCTLMCPTSSSILRLRQERGDVPRLGS